VPRNRLPLPRRRVVRVRLRSRRSPHVWRNHVPLADVKGLHSLEGKSMHGIIYIVGLVVVVLFVLSLLGLR